MRCQRVVSSFVAFLCFVVLSAANLNAQSTDPTDDVWRPLRSLLGTWEGTVTGQPGNGTSTREYRLVLGHRFVEIRNRSVYPPQEKNPKGETHEDVGYLSYDRHRKAFVLRQFHVEGFVNTYVATPSADNALLFTSEAIENIPAGAWQ